MQGDPWSRKKTVMVLAISDIALAIFLICYAGYRLLKYDYRDQSLIVLISSHEYIVVSVMYWIVVFAILSVQLVIAFLLLTATKDMTIDPDTMIKKCEWWRTTSFIFFVLLALDIFILVYEYYLISDQRLKIVRLLLSTSELMYRFYGVYFIGKFIRDLRTLFGAPMVQSSGNQSVPNSPMTLTRAPGSRTAGPVTSQRGIV